MRYPADNVSSHDYEVKKLHLNGATVDSVVFYLRAGEPVHINVEDVLKKSRLWSEPTPAEPKKEYHLIFEVEAEDEHGAAEIHISRFDVDLKE